MIRNPFSFHIFLFMKEMNSGNGHAFSEGPDSSVLNITPKTHTSQTSDRIQDDGRQISLMKAPEPYRDNPNDTSLSVIPPEHTLIDQMQDGERQISSPDVFEPYHDNPSVIYTSFEQSPEEDDKCGSDDEGGSSSGRSARKLWVATGISLIFFSIELVGGLIAGSLALLSDSFHLLSGWFF